MSFPFVMETMSDMRGPGVANGWMTEKCAQCTGDGVVVGTRRGVNLYGRHEDAAEVGSGTLLCHGSALPLFCDVVSYLAMLVRLIPRYARPSQPDSLDQQGPSHQIRCLCAIFPGTGVHF